MVHSWRKLITGVLITIIILWVASIIKPVDEGALATQGALYMIAYVAIGMEIILLIEQFGLRRRFTWRENLLRYRWLNSKIMWIALPFILEFILYLIEPNNTHGPNTSGAVANVFLVASVMAAGFDMLWLIKSGLGFFVFGIHDNFRDTGVFFGMEGGRMVGRNQDEDGHILVVGGAGTGKSSSIAIPTLAKTWTSDFLAIDIKGELAKESGRQDCIFDPCDPGAYGYDPFYFVELLRVDSEH